jgi:sporulation protein YlmC with PRC-barrel domain
VESIGPEAIMVRPGTGRDAPVGSPETFPRLSHITGRKVVTQSGKVVGAIGDVLIDGPECTIVGYQLKDASWTGSLGEMFKGDDDHPDYVRADADLRLSDELLVVPDDAVVHGRVIDDEHSDDEHSAIAALGHRNAASKRTTTVHETPLDSSPRATVHTAPLDDSTRTTTRRWHDVQPGFRSRWEQSNAGRGGLWAEHEPAYRYGWEASNEDRYRGRSWDVIQPDLQRDWETRYPDRPWSRFSSAVREGWSLTSDMTSDRGDVRDTTRETDFRQARETSSDESQRGGYDGGRSLL